jgi:hypothetical protein
VANASGLVTASGQRVDEESGAGPSGASRPGCQLSSVGTLTPMIGANIV